MTAAIAMSKLLDSLTGLTGYFFSGASGDAATVAGGEADPPADRRQPVARSILRDSAHASSRDLSTDPGTAMRLRDRLLRRPVHRSAGSATRTPVTHFSSSPDPASGPTTGVKPWGDDVVASPRIHPLAVVDPRADLAPDVEVGPFCVVGPHVSIGPGTRLLPRAMVLGHTTIGSDNVLHPGCVIGNDPQDKKFRGEETRLVIGDGNEIRENVTIHTGTAAGSGVTVIGDNNLIMVGAHIGHDAVVGDGCVLGNNIMLAGHVEIGNRVSMMGGAACHHFVTIGDFAFVGAYSHIHVDVPPYVKVDGEDRIRAVNVVGLRRSGLVDDADIAALEIAIRRLFVSKKQPVSVVIKELLADEALNPRVREVVDTIRRRALGRHGRYLEGNRKA